MVPTKATTTLTPQQQLLANQRVIVRIWTSMGNRGEDVGHISVQTPSYYMSLWPKKPIVESKLESQKKGVGLFSSVSHELLPSAEKDEEAEGRPPEVLLTFYDLDNDAIEKAFETLQQTLKGWTLLAKCKDGESCASLAYRLLIAGGLIRYLSKVEEVKTSSSGFLSGLFVKGGNSSVASSQVIVGERVPPEVSKAAIGGSFYAIEMGLGISIKSPDYCAEILKKAKKAELELYPETDDPALLIQGETNLLESKQRPSQKG